MAAVGSVMSLTGSISQYVGGLMSANSSAAGAGFMGIMQNLIEGPAFAATAGWGLPGLPTGVPDPLDDMVSAASSGPGSTTCQ